MKPLYKTDKILHSKLESVANKNELNELLFYNDLYLYYNKNDKTPIYRTLYAQNKNKENMRRNELFTIITEFDNNNIRYINFKGSVLAELIHEDSYIRSVGDIDIYVTHDNYEQALQLLFDMGYDLMDKFIDYTDHHICLKKDKTMIELHKHFFKPYMNIDNSYFENNVIDFILDNFNVKTLNHTSLLVYLFLHHYMHIVDGKKINIISTITNSKIEDTEPQYKRFYEIAILIEKYNDSINWDDFADYLCSQPLNYEFKKVVTEFNDLFAGYIPVRVLEILNNKEYIIKDNMKLYLEIENDERFKYGTLKFDEVLMAKINEQYENNMIYKCNQNDTLPYKYYIDEHSQDKYNVNNTYIQYGISPDSSEDLSYYFDFSIDDDYLYVNFDVTDDILVFIEDPEIIYKDYSAILACDNCSIVIAKGTGKYKYSNIFIYPVCHNNELSVVAYDLKQKITDITDYINPKVTITERGYQISTCISLKYLKIENFDGNHFYMDVAVCDCDDVTVGRKSVVSFSSRNGYWYDPRKFAKIIIEK